MKILFIINSLKSRSGMERVAINLANTIVDYNPDYKLTIINRDTKQSECAFPIDSSVNIIAIKGNLISFFLKLQSHIKKEQYDYILVHNMGRLALLCCTLLIPKLSKLITLEHGAFDARPLPIRLLSKLFYKKVNQVVCLTTFDIQSFSKIHHNTCLIPNFSSFPISSPKNIENNKTIIAIGRLTEEKNFSHLLKAWGLIQEKIPKWKLKIYGDGELKRDLEEQVLNDKLINISFMGSISDIKLAYTTASFIVMSSKHEGLPMVLIEAQTFGIPIVSYNCPHGPKEIIKHSINGFLVKNQNIEALADTMLQLISSELLLKTMSLNSSEVAKQYQSEVIMEKWNHEVFIK